VRTAAQHAGGRGPRGGGAAAGRRLRGDLDRLTAEAIRGKLRTLLQMVVVLTRSAALPVVKIGRLAGQ